MKNGNFPVREQKEIRENRFLFPFPGVGTGTGMDFDFSQDREREREWILFPGQIGNRNGNGFYSLARSGTGTGIDFDFFSAREREREGTGMRCNALFRSSNQFSLKISPTANANTKGLSTFLFLK